MSVLAPGLVFIEDTVRAGDEVFILGKDGSCVGVGRAKVDAAVAREMKKGPVVRTRRNIASTIVPGTSTWDAAVRANADELLQTRIFLHPVRPGSRRHGTRISRQTCPIPEERTAWPHCWW